MKVLYIDCPNGVSGDMLLGGLMGLGVDIELLRTKLSTMSIFGWHIELSEAHVSGIKCNDVTVSSEEKQPHRGLNDIVGIINDSGLENDEKELAIRIFTRLARAEAKVHGMSVDEIHFHEVGAIDAIVDICGAAIGLLQLKPDRIVCSPLPLGSGFVDCMHGRIPVPAPATLELLTGIPVYSNGMVGELVTPTGAAIVTTVSHSFTGIPNMDISAIGYGCGKKRFEIPNIVRLVLGHETLKKSEDVTTIECNIDDMSPEIHAYVSERLLASGALDVWTTPIQMKKGRPGIMLSVLCFPDNLQELSEIILEETTSFGIRYSTSSRQILDRELRSVSTKFGDVKVKIGRLANKVVKVVPEYEDCARLARENKVKISSVFEAARVAEWRRDGEV